MNKEQLKEYADLKIQEKAITARMKELGPLVLADILEAGFDKVPTDYGNFNIKKRKTWKYTDEVDNLVDRLKILQESEQATGAATFVEVSQLEFRASNNES